MANIKKPLSDRHPDLKRHVDEGKILAAIRTAEQLTTGLIHVALAKHIPGKTHDAAVRAFRQLGFASPTSTAVLIFVVPSRRELSVLGSNAIHAALGDAYWNELVASIAQCVRDKDLTAGLVHGIEDIGRQMARLFPKSGDRPGSS